MFSKKSHGDVKKSCQKVLDSKKDAVTRLKHLKTVIENLSYSDLKVYFDQYYSQIYQVFYENFVIIETGLRQKVTKAQREELDHVLFILERIIVYVPDLIHVRWHFNSIIHLLKKLLHVGNCLKVRQDGMRLFLLWFQVLQNNASKECYLIYATLVPNFPPPPEMSGTTLEAVMVQGIVPVFNNEVPIEEAEVVPLIPQQPGEKQPSNMSKVMLESLLRYSISEVTRMDWGIPRRSEDAFIFLLNCFKIYYLPIIFPEFSSSTSLYKSMHEIPAPRGYDPMSDMTEDITACRVSVVQWVVDFIAIKKNKAKFMSMQEEVKQEENKDSLERTLEAPLNEETNLSSTLNSNNPSQVIDLPGVSDTDLIDSSKEMVQRVFFSSRVNVNFVLEVLRQGFLLPMSEASAVRRALRVYKDWIQAQDSAIKPVFMSEPPPKEIVSRSASRVNSGETDDDVDSPFNPPDDFGFKLPDIQEPVPSEDVRIPDQADPNGIGNSYINDINQGLRQDLDKCNVEAGLQATVQIFITHAANVFLSEPAEDVPRHLRDQVGICEHVLNMYKHIVMNVNMEKQTWEQLLKVLLKITEGVLGGVLSPMRLSLGKHLAQLMFKTLIITWIKANLQIQVSVELWDEFLRVMSSLTEWEELIKEWAKTMETLTKVLARRVYGLDLSNLPLDKLAEQKRKRWRTTPALQAIQPITFERQHERTFSKGWGRLDSLSPQEEYKKLRLDRTGFESILDGNMHREKQAKLKDLAEKVGSGSEMGSSYPVLTRQRSLTVDPGTDLSMHRIGLLNENPNDVYTSRHSSHPVLTRQLSSTEDPGGGDDSDSPPQSPMLLKSSSEGDLLESVSQRIEETVPKESTSHTLPKSTTFPPARQDAIYPPFPDSSLVSPPTLPKSSTYPSGSQDDLLLKSEDGHFLDELQIVEPSDLPHLVPPDKISIESSLSVHTADSHLTADSNSITPSSLLEEFNNEILGNEALSPLTPPHLPLSEASTPSGAISLEGDDGSLQEPMEVPSVEEEAEEVFQSPLSSVMSGGTKTGWMPDVAVVVWRRMLGALGDINSIKNPELHSLVLKCLWDMWQLLVKMRDNLGISTDNLTTPPPPEYIPQLDSMAPWLFKATLLPRSHQQGRLWAYKLLCSLTVRRQDHPLPNNYLIHFYRLLHVGLMSSEQDVINAIVQYSCPEFFSCDLPGSTLLFLDFIHAANVITNSEDLEAPRVEALSLLGSLVCFPNMFCNLNLLQPHSLEIISQKYLDMTPVKDHLLGILLKCGRKEPNPEARCIALCSLSIFLYEELVHATFHNRMKDAINVLLVSLKFSSKAVAQMACDMLLMLSDQAGRLRTHLPETPKKIIEVIAITASTLLPSAKQSGEKKLLISLFFCLLEWCMAIPVSSLLEPTEGKNKREGELLLHTVFGVLQSAAEGLPVHPRWSTSLSELASPDYDPNLNLDNIKQSRRSLLNDNVFNEKIVPPSPVQSRALSSDTLKLTARTVLCHLMNRLNHFPLGGGPACITSLVSELDDLDIPEENSAAVFDAPNVQFFVNNDSAIISLVQLPTQDLDDENNPLGCTRSHVRIIVRDVCGKFCWDGSLLYGPKDSQQQPKRPEEEDHDEETSNLIESQTEEDREEVFTDKTPTTEVPESEFRGLNRPRSTVPSWVDIEDEDVLDELQQFLGYTSPECLLRPGIALNLPSPAPEEIPDNLHTHALVSLLQQCDVEEDYVRSNGENKSMISQSMEETTCTEPESEFYLCRQFLCQLGVTGWNKRSQIDVLKKNDKLSRDRLARELRNLDSSQCRETHKIAVLYIAEGQEDKLSVLSNTGGSEAYENFVAGLAWEVNLATHTGFMGGLQKNQSTGESAPYWATSSVEVVFHVSTRMPSSPEDHNKKMRHLGNDEVHIVWSEHTRDYRREIIPSEFGDVIIVIYPLKNKLFRIQIQRKADVPFFGPLFHGAIVDHIVLPGLVRATAVNASRVKRSQLSLYQRFYEERARFVDSIVKNHKKPSTFEEFSANVFEPSLGKQQFKGYSRLVGPTIPAPSLLHLDTKLTATSAKQIQKPSPSGSADKAVQSGGLVSNIRPKNFVQTDKLLQLAERVISNPTNKSTGTATLERESPKSLLKTEDKQSDDSSKRISLSSGPPSPAPSS